MNLTQAKTIIAAMLKGNLEMANRKQFGSFLVPIMQSLPGIGKTSVVEQIVEEEDWGLTTVIVAQYDAGELAGFPIPDKEKMVFNRAKPFWLDFPTNKPHVLLFDELMQADTSKLNIIAQAVNERRIGEHRIPDNVVIICAGNPMSARAGTNQMPTHLKDRLTFLNIEADHETFLGYSVKNDLDPLILGFIRNRPEWLSKFDPSVDACSSPRSWTRVDTILKLKMDPVSEMLAIAGQVGEAACADFTGYMKVANKIPDTDKILRDPTKGEIPEEGMIMYALCAALSTKVTSKTAKNLVIYLKRFTNREFAVYTLKDAVRRDRDLLNNEHIRNYIVSNLKEIAL